MKFENEIYVPGGGLSDADCVLFLTEKSENGLTLMEFLSILMMLTINCITACNGLVRLTFYKYNLILKKKKESIVLTFQSNW